MLGLCDCNNFFVSCERAFNPSLVGRPVVVLSNNDGCVVSRSNEAKQLGIKMGEPIFQIKELVERNNVAVYSSNYILYGDLSARIMSILKESLPGIEVYSIDEAFLDMRGIPLKDLQPLGLELCRKIFKYTGIPVSIGISHTKTLAKIASKLCKKYPKLNGCCLMQREEDIEKVLGKFDIGDVWGIGRRHLKFLQTYGIKSALDFARMSPYIVRKEFTITGLKTWKELRGEPCITFEEERMERAQICVSRSFATELTTFEELHQAIADFTATACGKLRRQRSICGEVMVFLLTNMHKEDAPQYFTNHIAQLPFATDSTLEILQSSVHTLKKIYREGYGYKKAGVVLGRIAPKCTMQQSLFSTADIAKEKRLMQVMDSLNNTYGNKTLVVASQGFEGIKMNRNHLSKRYTTEWEDILEVNCR